MDLLTILGLIAATLTTVAFLPQMIKTWQTKSAKDVSFAMLITFITGVALWLIYGILRRDLAIILANTMILIFNCIILSLKIRYR
ncbi:MAG: SemiSWEET transporter [Nostocaceae cyanobacterium]|nr:SemiSWEET transporter [Nostocaceae cyanobacterium]